MKDSVATKSDTDSEFAGSVQSYGEEEVREATDRKEEEKMCKGKRSQQTCFLHSWAAIA